MWKPSWTGAAALSAVVAWLLASRYVGQRAAESGGQQEPGRPVSLAELAGKLAKLQPGQVETLSVVLPCANESEFVWRTVQSIFQATPATELKEIIVVDDASSPPVTEDLASEFLVAHRTRVVRHDQAEGLIRSKKDGGDAATGDAIVFLDCHVKPMDGWTEPILAHLRQNPKRIVVPSITTLDPDTWQEVSPMGGGSKMCLTWNADFQWCNGYPGPYVPIMSGGLLALTKYWWESTGGYDDQMRSWGGENLDQSLRTWLCGGEIMVANGSRVAHMWRDHRKPKTMMKYTVPSDHVRRNRLRAAEAWLGKWAAKVRSFPEFEDFREGGELQLGSLDNINQYRKALQCKGFRWYLDHFRELYVDTGMLPKSTFHLREKSSGLCLYHHSKWSADVDFRLAPCNRFSDRQRFHPANVRPDKGGCCSGLKLWNFKSCLAAYDIGSNLNVEDCEAFGDAPGQHFTLLPMKRGVGEVLALEWQSSVDSARHGCVAPMPPGTRGFAAGLETLPVSTVSCASHVERAEGDHGDVFGLRILLEGFCLSSASGAHDVTGVLHFLPCSAADGRQVWRMAHAADDGRIQLQAVNGFCLDVAGSGGPVVRECQTHEVSDMRDQLFHVDLSNATFMELSWRDPRGQQRFCFGERSAESLRPQATRAAAAAAKVEGALAVALAPCGEVDGRAKAGQGFERHDMGEDGAFEIRQQVDALMMCLGQGGSGTVFLAPCGTWSADMHRWFFDSEGQLKSRGNMACMSTGDELVPVLTPCPTALDVVLGKGFAFDKSTGWLHLPAWWRDNGRQRFAALCMDSDPTELLELTVLGCQEAENAGISWERVWEEVPLETSLFEESEPS